MRRLAEITGMRGLAALLVVGFHAVAFYASQGPGWPPGWLATILSFGWIGVDFFFVLSGFLLSLPLIRNPRQSREPGFWRNYLAKRWLRIALPYYASILLALALAGNLGYLQTGWTDVLAHAFYVHNFTQASYFSIVGVYWTLAVEFQFYLLLPFFVIPFTTRHWKGAVVASFVMSMAWLGFIFAPGEVVRTTWLAGNLLGFIGHFALGIALARVYTERPRLSLPSGLVGATGAVGFVFIPLMISQGPHAWHWVPDLGTTMLVRNTVAVGCGLVLLAALQAGSVLQRTFSSRPAVALGEMSYSIYLVHIPILELLIHKAPHVMDAGFSAFVALYGALSLAASAVFYFLVERPGLAFKDWATSRSRRQPTAPAAPLMAAPERAPQPG